MLVAGISIFILGMVTGSFLNVCIHRIPRGESVVGMPSYCAVCRTKLKPWDLVPLFSYLFSKGRCRYCGGRISIRYPLVEAATGLVFLLLYKDFGFSFDFAAYAYFMSVLIAIFFIDLEHKMIPNGLVLAALAGGIAVTAYHAFVPMEIYHDSRWWSPLLGMIPGTGFLFLVAFMGYLIFKTEDAMGMGDIKIFAPIGIFLGWKLCLLALAGSVLFAGTTSVFLLLFRIMKRKDTIPFGPFIVTSAFIALMWGEPILEWYFF